MSCRGWSRRGILEKHKLHLDACSNDFNYAWEIICKAQESGDERTRFYLFEYVVVIYCRSFKPSNIRGNKKMLLNKADYIDSQYNEVHDIFINHRDKYYVHSDVKHRSPQFYGTSYVSNSTGYPRASLPSKIDPNHHERQFLSDRMDIVQEMLENILDKLYVKIAKINSLLT